MNEITRQKTFAWIAIISSAVFANLWAYWGIIENFHEGWYMESFWKNVLMMFGQYLLMPVGFIILAMVSIRWNKAGAILHLLLAIASYFFFGKMHAGLFLIAIPLVCLAVLYWFGKIEKRRFAYILVAGLPLLQIIGIGTFFGIRTANRYDDNNFAARMIEGNGVTLIWAPQGPGWPDNGTSWYDAKRICAHLNEDGSALLDEEVNIWRLPTVDEAVRSLVHHGKNAGGTFDTVTRKAHYIVYPDKESPLWNMHLKTIYWWTETEVDKERAYIIVYNGGVWPRMKSQRPDYMNFRAVKDVK
jgi:hypothetical protein